MRLTPTQRRALMLAYADDRDLFVDPDPAFGVSRRTVTALIDRGLLVERAPDGASGGDDEDDGDDETVYALTRAGRRALGVHVPPSARPKRFRTALRRLMRQVLGEELPALRPRELNAVFYSDERRGDFRGALAVIDLRVVCGYGAPVADGDDGLAWSVIATALTAMGFPCFAEADDQVVAFWPEDD